MKQLKCEMCGGTDLVKQDGVFVCQSCGIKYSLEEAKKMMIEGVVEVKGTVSIDHSNELNNYLIRAKEFFDRKEYFDAELYYNKVLDIDANNIEAKNGISRIEKIITSPNLTVERGNARGSGEAKTFIYINGTKYKNFDLDYTCKITLPVGNYKIHFKRAAVKSNIVDVTITDRNDKYTLIFKPSVFGIKAMIYKS